MLPDRSERARRRDGAVQRGRERGDDAGGDVHVRRVGQADLLYSYCRNTSVNTVDSDGKDAIWLQDTDNVWGLGHTGLLIQDDYGAWFHFYYGGDPKPANKRLQQLEFSYCKEDPLWYLNGNLKSFGYYDGTYEKTIYIEGDFKQSIQYIRELDAEYNLLTNNCVQVSCDVLAQGNFKVNNSVMKEILSNARSSMVPNVTYDLVALIYDMAQKTWENYKKYPPAKLGKGVLS